MKFWVVDEIGGTYVFANKRAAKRFARQEKTDGAEDLTIGTIPASDIGLLTAVAEYAVGRGADNVKRLTPESAEVNR